MNSSVHTLPNSGYKPQSYFSLCVCVLATLIFLISPSTLLGQEEYCGNGISPYSDTDLKIIKNANAGVNIPTTGQFRALIVFVKFDDDDFVGTCSQNWLEWEPDDPLPDSAHDYLVPAASGGLAPSPPFPEHTLTNYFYQQSNQNFILYGEPFDHVIETLYPESHYGIINANFSSTEGMRILTEEVLDYIDNIPGGFEFDQYDNDGSDGIPNTIDDDGFIDHIFIIPRRFNATTQSGGRLPTWSGFSILGTPTHPQPLYDNKRLNWDLSGSYNRYGRSGGAIPLLVLGRLMAHEFVHDLLPDPALGGVHLQPIRGNDVPFGPPFGTFVDGSEQRTTPSNRVAYALMPGAAGANDMAGIETLSAYERDLLNWVSCTSLQTNQSNLTLDELYSSGDCYTVPLSNGSSGKTVYISNLQNGNYFNNEFSFLPCTNADDGLQSTGLLVGLSKGSGANIQYDELPADNTLTLTLRRSFYEGDLFSPSTSTQITPWTRPNINGFTDYDTPYQPSWEAIDYIRYTSGSSGQMRFDFKSDFRQSPTIREDSWIGAESAGITLTGNTFVTNEATLNIGSNINIQNLFVVANSEVLVEPGATVTVTGTLSITGGGRLHVRPGGELIHNGLSYKGHVFTGQSDTFMDENEPSTPQDGTSTLMAWGPNGALLAGRKSSLMKWNTNGLSTNTITSVKMRVNVTNATSGEGYEIHELIRSWIADDATWYSHGTGSWGAPGATGASDVDDPVGTFIPTSTGEYELSFNTDGIAMVEGWVTSALPNNGVVVAGGDTNGDDARWYSVESSNDPELEVTYVEPASGPVETSLKVLMAGPYSASGIMANGVNPHIPLSHPYGSAPWNYNGGGSLGSIPADMVDWVLVELATGDPQNPPLTVIAQKAALLKTDGSIVDTDGTPINFGSHPLISYYVIIRHRTHLDIMSASAISGSGSPYTLTLDLTSDQNDPYGNNPMKVFGDGYHGMWGGDASGNSSVTAFDYLNFWLPQNGGPPGYHLGDFNLSGSVTSFDFLNVWLPANGQASQVPATDVYTPNPNKTTPATQIAGKSTSSSIRGRLGSRSIGADKVELTLALRAEEAIALGTTTLWIGYNPAAVMFPIQPTEREQGDYSYSRFHSRNNAKYSSTVTHPLLGIISVNIALLERGRGSVVERASFAEALKLRFDVVNPTLNPDFRWLKCEVSDGEYRALTNSCSTLSQIDISDWPELGNVESEAENLTKGFDLSDAYPNPFNPQTRFTLRLAEDQEVHIELFDITGRLVRVLHSGLLSADDAHWFTIDGTGQPSGTYLYRVTGETFYAVGRVVLLK